MKLILVLLLLPGLAFCQKKSINQQLKESQAIADTMHFPVPFEFKYIDTVQMTKGAIYNKCYQWLTVILGNAKSAIQIQDSLNGKLVVTNVEAFTTDYSESITIDVKEGRYRLTIDNYLNTDYRDHTMPLDSLKDTKNHRLDKYFMILQNEATIKSLKEYVRKNDSF